MPLNPILEVEIFWCLGHWLHGTILKFIWQPVHLDCSRLRLQMGRSVPTKTNDNKVVKFFKKNIFSHLGTPRAIISVNESHFCNSAFEALMWKYFIIINYLPRIIPKQMGKLKWEIGKSSLFWKKNGRSKPKRMVGQADRCFVSLPSRFWDHSSYVSIQNYIRKNLPSARRIRTPSPMDHKAIKL